MQPRPEAAGEDDRDPHPGNIGSRTFKKASVLALKVNIAIFGTGYVGLVTGVCLADLGNDVVCADIDDAKIARLKKGESPIYEPGLREKLARNIREERIKFTTDLKEAMHVSELLFLCVGTPSAEDGSVNLQYIDCVAKAIGKYINAEKVVVNKSTVPVGTAERVRKIIKEELKKRGKRQVFHVVSNPEFLKEGAAVNDFFNPDRIVVGLEENDEYAREVMGKLYRSLSRTARPVLFTDIRSAELIKYASNAMLATRISFMNQLSGYCEAVGADITAVSKGMGLDTRIGPRFLHAGAGYGGSCLPKDVKGLIASIKNSGCEAGILEAVHEANEAQKQSLMPKIERMLSDVKGKKVAVWGLSFKPKTDDVREAPSLLVIDWLLKKGAEVRAFDPEGMNNFKQEVKGAGYGKNPYEILEGADLLILLTEWDAFRNPDWERMKKLMRAPRVLDGRNIYPAYKEDLKTLGFEYVGVGVPE